MTIEIFQGQNVRIETKDNKVWFALPDVCKILGIGNATDVAKRLREATLDKIESQNVRGQKRLVTFVNERGLIRVFHTSNSPLAEPFQDWADERVEQLMNGKTVNAGGVVEESEDAIILRAIETLQARVEEQKKELEEARPKVEVHDKVLEPGSSLGFRQVASTLRDDFPDLTEPELKRIMREDGLIYKNKVDSTAKAREAGYAIDVVSGTFGGKTKTQTRWTPEGIAYIIYLINQ